LVWPEGPPEEGTSQTMFVVVEIAVFPMMVLAGLGAVISLIFRFRRARGDERQQIKWFASALSLALVFAWNFLLDVEGGLLQASLALASLILAPAIPIATGIAILRCRLYDIDRIINRTLVYGALTAALVLLYVLGIVLFQSLFRALTGQESQLAVVASTLVIAALFGPLRRRMQSFIDRRFYRNKYDAEKTLQDFGARLRDVVDLDTLRGDLVAVVEETLRSEHVSFWLRPSGRMGDEER
jgi:hypothetical protein